MLFRSGGSSLLTHFNGLQRALEITFPDWHLPGKDLPALMECTSCLCHNCSKEAMEGPLERYRDSEEVFPGTR